MPSYRGIDHADIFASIREGLSFLKEKNIGPATAKRVDEWMARNPDFLTHEPEDAAAFVKSMRAACANLLFSALEPVFAASAAIEAKDNLPGAATKIYSDLMAWGAFQAYENDDLTKAVDAEAQRHVMSLCLDRLKKEDCAPDAPAWKLITDNAPLSRSEDHIPEIVHIVRQSKILKMTMMVDPAIIEYAHDMVPVLVDLHEMNLQEPIDDLIANNKPAAYEAGSMLYHMTGLKQAENDLQIVPPLRAYAISVPDNGRLDGMQSLLLKYYIQDEAIIQPLPVIFPEENRCSLIFGGTKNFAQAVANYFPQYEVAGPNGEIIKPSRGPEPGQPQIYKP